MIARFKRTFRSVRMRAMRCLGTHRGTPMPSSSNSALVLAPHPDDEVFGAGGLAACKRLAGAQVDVVFLTCGGGSHASCCGAPRAEIETHRRLLALAAARELGIEPTGSHWLQLEDGSVPRRGEGQFEAAVDRVVAVLSDRSPAEVCCPHPMDVWADHVAAAEITQEAVRRWGGTCRLYYYIVWAWHNLPLRRALRLGWRRSWRLDISSVMDRKRAAMDAYLSSIVPGCGKPYVGVIPKVLLNSFQWPYELFFEAEDVATDEH